MFIKSIHALSLLAFVQDQRESKQQFVAARVDPMQLVRPDTITRYAMNVEGYVIISTELGAFPEVDGFIERCEVINLANFDGKRYFLATVQLDSVRPIREILKVEARLFAELLPEAGAHFGTTAQADTTYKTEGVLYVTNERGVLQQVVWLDGQFRAFSVGHQAIAVQDAGLMCIMSVDIFLHRVLAGHEVIEATEGMRYTHGMRLTRGLINPAEPLLAVQEERVIRYYDQHGQEHEEYRTELADRRTMEIPQVNEYGQQNGQTVHLRVDDHDQGQVHYYRRPPREQEMVIIDMIDEPA